MSSRLRSFLGYSAAFLVAGGAFSACDSFGPGDYRIYRIAVTHEELSKGCYGTVPPDIKNDATTFRDSRTIILTAGANDTFFLDLGDISVEGTETDDGYAFEGKEVDVEYMGPNDTDPKITATRALTVGTTVDGASISGQIDTKTSYKCAGNGCPAMPASCTVSVEFIGTEVDDITLKYGVDDPGNVVPDPVTGHAGGSGAGAGSAGGGTGAAGGGTGAAGAGTTGGGGHGAGDSSCNVEMAPYSCGGFLVSCGQSADPPSDCYDGQGQPAICEASASLFFPVVNCICEECWNACPTMCGSGGDDTDCADCQNAAGGGACNDEIAACLNDV